MPETKTPEILDAETVEVAAPVQLPMSATISMLERVLVDGRVPMDRLRELMAMRDAEEAKIAEASYNRAMAAASREIPIVIRDRPNEQTQSKYATLGAIHKAVKPITAKHGFSFSCVPAPTEKPGFLGFIWTNRHEDGHKESGFAELPSDMAGIKGSVNKTAVHGFGSTSSYARRYLYCMVWDVSVDSDDDGNAGGGKVDNGTITTEQFTELRQLLKDSGSDEKVFISAYGGGPDTLLEEFPAKIFEGAVVLLRRKAAKAKAAPKTEPDIADEPR